MNLDLSTFELEQGYKAEFGYTYTARAARRVSNYVSILTNAIDSGKGLTDVDFGLPMYSEEELL